MSTNHTPGPWHYDAPCIKGCREDMYPILIDVEGSGLADADIRLVTAAPELLAIVQQLHDDWPEFDSNESVNGADLAEYIGGLRLQLKALLAKVQGE